MGLVIFSRLYCFILKWQLSPLLPLERLPVHLDCHLMWPPGLSRASRRLAALLRDGLGGCLRSTGTEVESRRWLQVGRRLSALGVVSISQPRERRVLLTTRRRPSVH